MTKKVPISFQEALNRPRVGLLLSVRDLTARYGSIPAVRNLDLEVRDGELVAILGANGAGKTTTLSCIAGVMRSGEGSIAFAGEEISGLPPEAIVRRGVTLAPQGRRLFQRLSVAENLALGAAVRAGRRAEVEADQERLLELFPVLRRGLQQPAGLLSGGEQQQLAIGRALMSRPRLLLLDEPTLGLAPLLIKLLFEHIVRLRQEWRLSVLLAEQNVHQALDVCDRAYVLRSGRMEMDGPPRDLLRSRIIEQAYLGVGTGAVV